jgi:hypothetical protein
MGLDGRVPTWERASMKLDGSCQCGKIHFSVDSDTPYPFMYCYCSICRKLSGGAFGCNVMGKRATLKISGKKYLRSYHAVIREKGKRPAKSHGERCFCSFCGTHLWVADENWPEGVWPNAGAIDTELPIPPEHVHMMTRYKPEWVAITEQGPRFPRYPEQSIAAWHDAHGLVGAPRRPRAKSKKGR